MNLLTDRPWAALYPARIDPNLAPKTQTVNEAWAQRVGEEPEAIAIEYFDGRLTVSQLDEMSDALAAVLQDRGVSTGSVIGIYLQNIPQYVMAMLAIWKCGSTALVLNPMYKGRELRQLVKDSGAIGIFCLDRDFDRVRSDLDGTDLQWITTTSDRDLQNDNDPRVFKDDPVIPRRDDDLVTLLAENAGRKPFQVAVTSNMAALLTYTSGTTGPAKGSIGTHENVLYVAAGYAAWQEISPRDTVLAVAPLFHITGAVATAVTSLISSSSLVFINRPVPSVLLEALKRHSISLVIGSITVFNAVLELPNATSEDFTSLRLIYSGGAPIPPATVGRFQERFGHYIHNVYGMTETSSAVIAVPPGCEAPVDPSSGTLSIGVPMPNLIARVVDQSGNVLPAGSPGELELEGPQITPGYLNRPEESARALPGGRLRTGDVAIMDQAGWIYLVDRMKDQINTSGYKVWPREVEDVLYEHPAILEAAVIGRPDAYRGETVVAYVSFKANAAASVEELRNHCRKHLAAYKYPREIHILEDLPKTHTGKIQRRELRAIDATTSATSRRKANHAH
jgi:long-chain acyl-CoA synthetase